MEPFKIIVKIAASLQFSKKLEKLAINYRGSWKQALDR